MLGRVHRWRKAAPPGVALVLAAGLGWLGCGGSSDSPSSPTTPTPPPTTNACSAVSGGASSGLAILNGTECSTSNTSVVLLNLRDATGQAVGQCTGTVISSRAVLTAAHCLDGDTGIVRIWVGTGDQVTASSFQSHPRYSASSGAAFDVGVVLASEDLGRTPIPALFSRDARVGESVVVSGWGRDQNGNGTILRAGLNTISAVNSAVLETQYSSTTASVCYGDSGGPLLVAESGGWATVGVTSETSASGYNCTASTSYFTNIRHPEIQSFILGLVPDAARR